MYEGIQIDIRLVFTRIGYVGLTTDFLMDLLITCLELVCWRIINEGELQRRFALLVGL